MLFQPTMKNYNVSRLTLQYNILKELYENRILLAPIRLDATDAVLDIGTGPGLWITDLADSVDQSIPMHAVDIESRLFPASPPENIEFRVESVTHLPVEWTSTFSLVHQQLLMAALQKTDWVQLGESKSWTQGRYPEKSCMEKLVAMVRSVGDSRNLYLDCAHGMPKMLAEAGFVEIETESRMQPVGKWAGEAGVEHRINQVSVFKGFKTPILEAGGFGYVRSEKEYDMHVEGAEKEWDEIPGTEKEFFIFWAKKPLLDL
ncbi:hypothetical protein DFH08DRAFT_908803 [Mycena albidolilacea]|uniref:S-adenosyl-L-methionine-dependent methyltransferase n=1 Tax=Mycena albidolilacea TaxID=1033008 RepID=A0AAD7ATB9_9AGAR|nr:hypothetical protein DFH08DRAFT_908803 [Mycena albidolilacea]